MSTEINDKFQIEEALKPSDVKIDQLDELCYVWQKNNPDNEWINYPDEINVLLNIYYSAFIDSGMTKYKIVYILDDTFAEFNEYDFYTEV